MFGAALLADWFLTDTPEHKLRVGIESTGTVVGTGIAGGNRFPTLPPPFDRVHAFSLFLPTSVTVGQARDIASELIPGMDSILVAMNSEQFRTGMSAMQMAELQLGRERLQSRRDSFWIYEGQISSAYDVLDGQGRDPYSVDMPGWGLMRTKFKDWLESALRLIQDYYQAIGENVSFGEAMGAFGDKVLDTAADLSKTVVGGAVDFVFGVFGDFALIAVGGLIIWRLTS